jgi:hypothetical protein
MAQLYFNEQLIATSSVHGILGHHLMNEEIVITYQHSPKKYYTIVMNDANQIHSFIINIKGDQLETGDIIVDYIPFEHQSANYDGQILIYQQPKPLVIPMADFDMDDYVKQNKLKLIHVIDFTVLQKLERKPNLFSNRVYTNKLIKIKSKK